MDDKLIPLSLATGEDLALALVICFLMVIIAAAVLRTLLRALLIGRMAVSRRDGEIGGSGI